ncbi:hypothetical protein D3C72_1302880 [compost metagenome]
MDGGGAQAAQGGVVGVQIRDQLGLGRPMTIQVAEGVSGDLVPASDQVAHLGGVGEAPHVSALTEQAGADVEGAERALRLERLGSSVAGAGGDVVEGEADGRPGQVQPCGTPVRQAGEAATQFALEGDVGRVGLDHIASA